MKFSDNELKAMCTRKKQSTTTSCKYTMIGSKLAITTQENDLEVIVDSSLNISTECLVAVKTENRMLKEIRKGIKNKPESFGMSVHKSIVCLYPEATIILSLKI